MSLTHKPHTSAAVSDALRLQMERSIDELAELARKELEPGRFFSEVLRRSLQPGGANHALLWRTSLEGPWESAGEMPAVDSLAAADIENRQALLNEVAGESQPRVIVGTAESSGAGGVSILSPLRHANATVGILETTYTASSSGTIPPAVYQFLAALCEITADYLSQQELQQLRRAKGIWLQWDQYQQRLQQSNNLAAVGATIVNDGRVLVNCDRAAILIQRHRRFQVLAISGVERPDQRAGAVQAMERLVEQVARIGKPIWLASPTDPSIEPAAKQFLDRYLQESGATQLGVIPIPVERAAASNAFPMLILERFSVDQNWAGAQSRSESLAQRSAFALQSAVTLDEVPGLLAWHRWRQAHRLLRRPVLMLAMVAIVLIIVVLIVIPAPFTVTGHGELWPSLRRDVFASTSGIIDQILVKHGDDVIAEQPLIVLRDPELEQDTPRIMGEVATTRERLRSVQLARLTGSSTVDAAGKARQLAADEEELKERLKTLERQRLLIEERQRQLTLRSPIAGRVLSWDVTQHLSARPVERGQSLLTIGETAGAWIVEIHVADKDIGHLLRAQKAQGEPLEVDFQLPSEPGQTHRGTIREVSLASDGRERSGGQVRVVVEFDSKQVAQLRPGATAIPRIHCGTQSLGYVWLHDLIDAIRIRLML